MLNHLFFSSHPYVFNLIEKGLDSVRLIEIGTFFRTQRDFAMVMAMSL